MVVTLESLIQYVKDSCMVTDPNILKDDDFIALTDKQIEDIISVASSRIDADPYEEANLYKVTLLAKKEIYHRLAISNAPLYDIEGDGSGSLKRSNRFKHYYELIKIVENEYTNLLEELETNTDTSNTSGYGNGYSKGEVFLSSRYNSTRNYNHATKPVIILNTDLVEVDYVDISWRLKSINRFLAYKLYISNKPIIDIYEDTISSEAQQVLFTYDIHKDKCRIRKLTPNTLYHLAIIVEEQNGLIGVDEIQFVTKEVVPDVIP